MRILSAWIGIRDPSRDYPDRNYLEEVCRMESPENRLRWGAEQRLEFIEFQLFWEGVINRSDITARFGVSVPQASNDLTLYRELAPGNLEYDASAKRYVTAPSFAPRFLKPNPDRYLAQLMAVADGIMAFSDTWMSTAPSFGVLPIPGRRIVPETLRALLNAIRGGSSLHIEYQSMNPERPDPLWRWITPHAFGSDGMRWHVRAFCHRRDNFVDFLVSRCLAIGASGAAGARAEDDWRWQNFFEVHLEPNPELAVGQRRAIELDYGMTDGRVTVPVRHALLYYFIKRLRLDVGAHLDDPPERPIIVANRDDFDRALADAKV